MSKKRRAPRKPAPRKFLTREDILRTPNVPRDAPAAAAAWRCLAAETYADLVAVDERLRWLNDAMLRRDASRAPAAPVPPPPAPSTASPAPVRLPRRKITEEIWAEHLRLHPLDKKGPDGKPLGAPTRRRLLASEQDVHVSRSTVTRWLQRSRAAASSNS